MQRLHPDASSRAPRQARTLAIVVWLAWALFWAVPLHHHWESNPQYGYGWLVPVLAGILAWRRWATRPEPSGVPGWARPCVISSALILLPIWLIAQPNADWRLIPWMLMASLAGGCLGFLALFGGRSWARHFAFPVIFLATAIPWPGLIEAPLVQGLMKFVAEATVVILNATGIPALQMGNLVEVRSGVLGIDNACSGVRSLQATFMAALFLGEYHRLSARFRWSLVASGFAAAMVTNIGRTWLLARTAAVGGVDKIGEYHDPAGYTIFTICLVILAMVAEWMRRRTPVITINPASTAAAHAISWLPVAGLAIWFLAVFFGAELWYRGSAATESKGWTVAPPGGAEKLLLSAEVRDLLGCDYEDCAVWREAFGAEWTMFFLQWKPDAGRSVILARAHRPEACLPGIGLQEIAPRGRFEIEAAGFQLAFESLHFRDPRGRDFFVFFCPWEVVPGGPGRNVAFDDSSRRASLERVWRRERFLGQQTLELVVTGYSDRESAESALANVAKLLIRPETQPAVPK